MAASRWPYRLSLAATETFYEQLQLIFFVGSSPDRAGMGRDERRQGAAGVKVWSLRDLAVGDSGSGSGRTVQVVYRATAHLPQFTKRKL
jgi:hypothetical protein